MITLRICVILCSYFAVHPVTHAQTIGLTDLVTNTTLTTFDITSGDFEVTSLYSITDDLPKQREALKTLYDATGGPHWSFLYNDPTALDAYMQYEQELLTTGYVYLNATDFIGVYTRKVPWFTDGYSYCHWAGVTCCLTAGTRILRECTAGYSSVGSIILLGANMNGTLPANFLASFQDLAILGLAFNEGLMGQMIDAPAASIADLCLVQLQDTKLQNACATPGPGGTTANYYGDCYSNLFAQDDTGRVTVPDRPGMWCPDIVYRRPTQNGSHVSSTVCELNAASLLTSYHGCLCTSPLVPYYYVDTSGLFQMSCVKHNRIHVETIVIPVVLVVVLCYASWVLFAYWPRLRKEWNNLRAEALKRRHAPGTLMDSPLARGSDVFQSGMCLVMTDVEGSTALWEWNGHVMNVALGLHDYTLRSLLPKYFGNEVTTEGDAFILAFHDPLDAVGWALHAQLALLEAPWPSDIFQHPLAKVVNGSDGKLLFRGPRVRMAIHTGIPDEIIVHNVTKQVEYRGELVQLTEALSHLPAGGQVLLSDPTYLLVASRLHDLKLPSVMQVCPELSAKSTTVSTKSRLRLATSSSMKSFQGLLRGVATSSLSSTAEKSRKALSRLSWPRKRRTSGSIHHAPSPQASGEVCVEVLSDSGVSTDASQAKRTSNEKLKKAEATILDMGNYLLSECRNRPYTAEDAALPPIAGEHVVQVLPQDLLGRAALFPAMDPATQVAPSFFDAPAARAAGLGGVRRAHSANFNVPAFLSSPRGPLPSFAFAFGSSPHQHPTLPGVTYAVVYASNFKEVMQLDEQVALIALGRFKSCVRTTLLLCRGYECQEQKSTISAAFASPCDALDWAITLQLSLLRVPWGGALLSLEPAQEELHPDVDQVILCGLAAQIGIAQDPIDSLSPHATTGILDVDKGKLLASAATTGCWSTLAAPGRAAYAGACVTRAMRLCSLCSGGQILVEQSLVGAVQQERGGLQAGQPAAVGPSQIARRNYELLVHRQSTAIAASELTCSTSTLSAIVGRTLSQAGRRISTWPSSIPKVMRHQSMDSGLLAAYRVEAAEAGKPVGSGPSGSRPRRASLPVQPKRRLSSLFTKDSMQDAMHAFKRPSTQDEFKFGKLELPLTKPNMARAACRRDDVFLPTAVADNAALSDAEDAELSPEVPHAAVGIEVYRVGLFSYKGSREKYSLCQVYPASLSERRNICEDIGSAAGSSATCLHRDESLLLQTDVMLPDLNGLPLAAEPPLYINMTQPDSD